MIIEPLESRIAPAAFLVTNTNDSGAGSLRQAILNANLDSIADVINFAIGGGGTKIIALTAQLPVITQPLTIDGYSQAGSLANTADVGTNAVIRIVLDGSDVSNADGLAINSDDVTIRGLAIHGFTGNVSTIGNAIGIVDGTNILITGCFLGTDADGATTDRNSRSGVNMGTGAANVTIGGSALADRNLISNNSGPGITARGTNITIRGNLIGVGIDGISPLSNSNGIEAGFITGATIGGVGDDQNIIANNRLTGISLFAFPCTGVNILPNSIFRNGTLEIDLGVNGPTPNDPLDADTGQNGLQNFPVITGITVPGLTEVAYTLDSSPNTSFRFDFYASPEPDPTGFGGGRDFLGTTIGNTDNDGHFEGVLSLLGTFALGTTVTATATNLSTVSTSEFSRGFNVNDLNLTNATTATWRDGDGDLVTLKVSKGTLTADQFFFAKGALPDGAILQLVQFTDASFEGANLSITVKKAAGGDGRVAVGFIDATGLDLGKVNIAGDLGRITCGNADTTTISLGQLKVQSFGVAGVSSLPGGVNSSVINGAVGSIKIASDFRDSTLVVTALSGQPEDVARVRVESLVIGGDVSGDLAKGTQISINGAAAKIVIGGTLVGGPSGSGSLSVFGDAKKVTIGEVDHGVVTLGTAISATDIHGKLTIKGDLNGGVVSLGLSVDQVIVAGSVIGDRSGSGTIISTSNLANVTIRGDLVGPQSSTGLVGDAAVISSAKSIERITIVGSIIGGSAGSGGTVLRCGAIRAGDVLGTVLIGGDTIGSPTSPVVISGIGQAQKPTEGVDVAIRSVTIRGNATNTLILGGFDSTLAPANADASIGSVKVGKNWVGSSIATGVQDAGQAGFGSGDVLQTVDDTALVATIASIRIGGSFFPSVDFSRSFGFVAQEISKLIVAGSRIPLQAGAGNDDLAIGAFANLHLLEI